MAKNKYEATELLVKLMSNNKKAFSIFKKASSKLEILGDIRLSAEIAKLFKKEKKS